MNELLWIALPAGLDGARCVLRVMVVAKLDGPTVQASGPGKKPHCMPA